MVTLADSQILQVVCHLGRIPRHLIESKSTFLPLFGYMDHSCLIRTFLRQFIDNIIGKIKIFVVGK